jgi:outer membrane protein assembly factor BamB
MWHKRTSESTRIGLYWDAAVTGSDAQSRGIAAEEIDPTLAETLSRLERIDDARPASADFSRRFETQFLEAIGVSGARTAFGPGGGAIGPEVVRGPAAGGRLIELPVGQVDRRRLLAAIAAAILLFAAVAASYSIVSERQDGANIASDVNEIPAPPADFAVPMDRGNPQRSGVLPGPGLSGQLELRWRFEAGRSGISAPALVGDTLFISGGSEAGSEAGGSGSVIAIDFVSGSERWRFPTEHVAAATPAVVDGIVYASDTGGVLYALDAETGDQLWRADLEGGWTSAPVVANQRVFIAVAPYQVSLQVAVRNDTVVLGSGLVGLTEGVRLFALDPLTGEQRWQSADALAGQPGVVAFDTGSGAPVWTVAMSSLESGPAISGQRVFAGSSLDRAFYALDLASGDEIWQAPIDEDLPLNSSPAIAGGSVFVTTQFGKIVSLDEATGAERWRASAEHVSLSSSAIVVDEIVYVVDTAYGVSAISAVDGSVLWSEELELAGQVVVSPIVLHGTLFIGTSLIVEEEHIATLWAVTGSSDTDRNEGEAS